MIERPSFTQTRVAQCLAVVVHSVSCIVWYHCASSSHTSSIITHQALACLQFKPTSPFTFMHCLPCRPPFISFYKAPSGSFATAKISWHALVLHTHTPGCASSLLRLGPNCSCEDIHLWLTGMPDMSHFFPFWRC